VTSGDTRFTANLQGHVVKVQGHSVKTSSDHQIIALFYDVGVTKPSGDVRMFIEAEKYHLVRMCSANLAQNSPERFVQP